MNSLRRAAAVGLLAGLALIGLYLAIVRIGSASWPHAVELLLTDWYFVAAVTTGFGIQIGLFTHLRRLMQRNGSVRSATAMAAGGTATSTTSMVACCLHHLADVLPVIGLSGAAVFFTTYKVPVILFGLATNGLGIGMMVRTIRKHRGMDATSRLRLPREDPAWNRKPRSRGHPNGPLAHSPKRHCPFLGCRARRAWRPSRGR